MAVSEGDVVIEAIGSMVDNVGGGFGISVKIC